MADIEVDSGDKAKSLFTTGVTYRMSHLRDSGILWMINRQVFWPRGLALGLMNDANGEVTGWQLLGDGKTPITTDADEDALLQKFNDTIVRHCEAAEQYRKDN